MDTEKIKKLAKECAAECRIECRGEIADHPLDGGFDALFELLGCASWAEFKDLKDWEEIEKLFTDTYLEPVDIHEDIRARRKRLGLTQASLAEKAGFNQTEISHWESGKRSPSIEQLQRLAKILGAFVVR